MREEQTWMNEALEEGRKGLGTTSPNPPVGCVIVARGKIIGRGFHHRAGEPHAERMALADVRARGNALLLPEATVYVTLEPCSSQGRTPPCTEALTEAGVARVVYGFRDPDPRNQGRAEAFLAKRGIPCALVTDKTLERKCAHLVRGFVKGILERRPWVIAKFAMTLDGRITRDGKRWLSCQKSLEYAHILRLQSDAILVGGETFRRDNPALTVRCRSHPIPPGKEQPWRVVMTHDRASLPSSARLFTDAFAERSIVIENASDFRCEVLEPLHCERGVNILLLECGGRLLRKWLEAGLVDECVIVQTPRLSGGPCLAVSGRDFMPCEWRLARFAGEEGLLVCGEDVIVRGLLARG